jgi:hypothetical protein
MSSNLQKLEHQISDMKTKSTLGSTRPQSAVVAELADAQKEWEEMMVSQKDGIRDLVN